MFFGFLKVLLPFLQNILPHTPFCAMIVSVAGAAPIFQTGKEF